MLNLKGANMKRSFPIFLSVIFLLISLMISSESAADIFMKQKNHTDAFEIMGQTQPAREAVQTIWISNDKLRSDDQEQGSILRLDKQRMYMLDHARKTYVEMPMDMSGGIENKMQEAMDEEKMSPEDRAGMMNMMKAMTQMKITITPTDETKKIGEWHCRKYNQELSSMMGPMNSEIWATEDLKMDFDLYHKYMTAMIGKGGMFGGVMDDMLTEMKKIKGIPVLTISTVNMMGANVKTTQELLEYKEGTAPEGYFDIPAGYKKAESF